MELIQNTNDETNLINSVSDTQLIINDKIYQQSLIISNQRIVCGINLTSIKKLTSEHIQKLIQCKPDLIIFGTGFSQQFPDVQLINSLSLQNIGIEVMANKAASRTYNVLVTEERKVACLLILE